MAGRTGYPGSGNRIQINLILIVVLINSRYNTSIILDLRLCVGNHASPSANISVLGGNQ